MNRPVLTVGKSTRTGGHVPGRAYADDMPGPQRRPELPRREPPNVAAPGWPDTPATDPATETIRVAVHALATELGQRGLSLRAAGTLIGVPHTTLTGVLHGDHWPDALLIAKAETALNTRLWPGN